MRTILIRLMTNSYERAMYSLICNITRAAEPFGTVEIRQTDLPRLSAGTKKAQKACAVMSFSLFSLRFK